jgi:hypothetical protein
MSSTWTFRNTLVFIRKPFKVEFVVGKKISQSSSADSDFRLPKISFQRMLRHRHGTLGDLGCAEKRLSFHHSDFWLYP